MLVSVRMCLNSMGDNDFISTWGFGPADSLYTSEKACPRTIVLTGKCLQQQVAVRIN